ncbi:MAG TPA: type II toxin-antitoxin system prevent-host-death family antitoxin [Stellaceae bacterium]|nr:type II toxin-antitoxin system prevent-host-death family antitoxin [Stellaceae bacterium]
MRTFGLKILKDKLSKYVRLAAAGETVVITNHGRAVARSCRINQKQASPHSKKKGFGKAG